jgi:hypothetical protein
MTKEKFYTDYATAINWLNTNLILCNNIGDIDQSIYDNMQFNFYDEEEENYTEIFQWYLTDLTQDKIEWLQKTFKGLLFTYSDLLDCYVLCVDHFGTSWKYVAIEVLDKDWIAINKDKKLKH